MTTTTDTTQPLRDTLDSFLDRTMGRVGTYTIRGLKTWTTHDGGGWQGTLMNGRVPVCFFHNDGNGGDTMLEWLVPGQKYPARNPKPGDSPERDRLLAYLDVLAKDPVTVKEVAADSDDVLDSMDIQMPPLDPDLFIGRVVDRVETQRKFTRQMKTSTLFLLKSDKPGQEDVCMVIKAAYSPILDTRLLLQYGDRLLAIFNRGL